MNIVNNDSTYNYTQGFLTNTKKGSGKSFLETAKESFPSTSANTKDIAKEQTEGIGRASGQETKKAMEAYQKEIQQALLRDQIIAFGSANKEKEKKHTLFASDNGVFSEETLADQAIGKASEMLGDTGALTDEQIADFKEKYDVEHISDKDYEQLLTELVEQNIISKQDMDRQFLKCVPAVAMVAAADDSAFHYEYDKDNRLQELQMEMVKCQAYISAIENGRCSVHGSSLWETKHYFEEEYAYTKKIADILEQLKRGVTES